MDGKREHLNPNAMTVEEAAELFSKLSRRRIPATHIAEDVDAGAPTNSDGTLNVLHYAAWLLGEMRRGD